MSGSTWADWSATFHCPVYAAAADDKWLSRKGHPAATSKQLSQSETEILPGLTALICGGHFAGSMVLHSLPPNTNIPTLFVADTIFAVASSRNPSRHQDPGRTMTYQFLWSIPNMLPLAPKEILRIWRMLKDREFKATYGVIAKLANVYEEAEDPRTLRERLLDSARIAVRCMGHQEAGLFDVED